VFFLDEMLRASGRSLDGRTCVVSGSGNVAIYAIEKIGQLGGRVVACSDSDGVVHDADGIDLLEQVKEVERQRFSAYADARPDAEHKAGASIWDIPCEIAVPCATQNELAGHDARVLTKNGCIAVAEGANMPRAPDAVRVLTDAGVLFAPGKAANAGGAIAAFQRVAGAMDALGLV